MDDIDALLARVLGEPLPASVPKPQVVATPAPPIMTVTAHGPSNEVLATAQVEVPTVMDTPPAHCPQCAQEGVAIPAVPCKHMRTAPANLTQLGKPVKPLKLPTFSMTELAESFSIRNFGSLATLTTSRWTVKVKDRKAARETDAARHSKAGTHETYKNIVDKREEKSLAAVYQALDAARTKHYAMTLPWSMTGVEDSKRRVGARLLPNTMFFDYVTTMSTYKQDMMKALDKFAELYPEIVERAKARMGDAFDASEFPLVEDIRKRFGMDFDFQPVPEGGDFKGLPEAQLAALARAVNDKTMEMASNAMQDLWQRLHECMSHVAERLGNPDNVFHGTLVDKVKEISTLLGHLNLTNDSRFREFKVIIDSDIAPFTVEQLKDDMVMRSRAAFAAKKVLRNMEEQA